ncbi:MAG: EAL domain-containing protein [Siculibacillus sp.]
MRLPSWFADKLDNRPLSARGERIMLLAAILVLFLVDYTFGALHLVVAMVQEVETTLGSVVLALTFASWAGAFAYAVRRRLELKEMRRAKACAEAHAENAEITDGLTGLPNRAGLQNELRCRLAAAPPDGRRGVVIGLDIDRFKTLNEVSGHGIADRILVEVSDRLAVAVEDGDFVARVGADEFHVLTWVTDAAHARAVAARLRARISFRIEEEDPPVQIASSVGMVLFCTRAGDCDAEVIMRRVDIALQNAKPSDDGIALFSLEMEQSIRERAELEQALETAIETDEIQPYFQPVIDLATNRLNGFEVLARWIHPVRGMISPAAFIPIAEETGLLARMTTVLLRRACLMARDWPAHLKLAVNISPIDFKNPWLAEEILQVLTEVAFPPRRLEIEITENALVVDHEQAKRTITSLKNQGVSIALDDFGTGYASLHQLRMLPFDKIKIDQSFVRTMRDNTDSRMIVKAIIGLSGSLGLPTTAEGIESLNNADVLRDLGCTLGQGFLYSKAVPGDEVPQLLALLDAGLGANLPTDQTALGVAAASFVVPASVITEAEAEAAAAPTPDAETEDETDLEEIRRRA